ncbi:MAG: hypothetical protein IKN04_08770 [Clostridia bacterium]|nr:hypothetical protein [Clostridia bacterium]
MDKIEMTNFTCVERGEIDRIEDGGFIVKSLTRKDVESRPMQCVNLYVNEYKGDPPVEDKFQYKPKDRVYFFMFPDGRGMILGKMED